MATERTVTSGTAALSVLERGEPSPTRPTVVLAHGWPDRGDVWDLVADRLAADHHVVTFDGRGVGRSTGADVPRAYALERLAGDLGAVIDTVSPGQPVHLVGHDWGSVQAWEYVTTPACAHRVASFTSVSGMNLDHLARSTRDRLRRPTPRNLAPVVVQAARSAYTLVLSAPVVRTLMWRVGFARVFRWWLRVTEGIRAEGGYPGPGLVRDAVASVPLYRTNIWRHLLHPDPRSTAVPVQVVIATGDRYVSPRIFADIDRWVPDVCRRELDAGHWSPRTHPAELAELVATFVADVAQRGVPATDATDASDAGPPRARRSGSGVRS